MKKLSESLYVREDNLVLLHGHGPEKIRWCLVDISDSGATELVAMFADLDDGLFFAETKQARFPETVIASVGLVEE